jgi:hypothetical protein
VIALIQRRLDQRDERRRDADIWHREQRVAVYVEMSSTLNQIDGITDPSSAEGWTAPRTSEQKESSLTIARRATDVAQESIAKIELFGSLQTLSIAKDLYIALLRLRLGAAEMTIDQISPDDWYKIYVEFRDKLADLSARMLRQMRSDLKVRDAH